MSSLIWFIVVIIVFVGSRIALNMYFDRKRIRNKADRLGYKEVHISWSPFAPGALFDRNERHYRVSYLAENGLPYTRYCKTSIFTGVYWYEEQDM